MKDFHDLFLDQLNDIYSAEMQIEKVLPEMAKMAHLPELKEAFHMHHAETKHHITRLERIADELGIKLHPSGCDAIEGILKEGKKLVKENFPHEVRDAALIISAQRVEHYEITVYGVLKSFAKHLKLDDVYKILEESSKEEGHANKKLSQIAEGSLFCKGVNAKALKRESA
jgi:ferritin-like metal-binding protein YciE